MYMCVCVCVCVLTERHFNYYHRVSLMMSLSVSQQSNLGLCCPLLRFYITHRHTHTKSHTLSVGLLWTSIQPVAEAATLHKTQQTQETNNHALSGFWIRDHSR